MNNHLQRRIAVLALIVIAVSLFLPFVPVAHAEWTVDTPNSADTPTSADTPKDADTPKEIKGEEQGDKKEDEPGSGWQDHPAYKILKWTIHDLNVGVVKLADEWERERITLEAGPHHAPSGKTMALQGGKLAQGLLRNGLAIGAKDGTAEKIALDAWQLGEHVYDTKSYIKYGELGKTFRDVVGTSGGFAGQSARIFPEAMKFSPLTKSLGYVGIGVATAELGQNLYNWAATGDSQHGWKALGSVGDGLLAAAPLAAAACPPAAAGMAVAGAVCWGVSAWKQNGGWKGIKKAGEKVIDKVTGWFS
ncbi:hypothetical protein SAMN04488112_1332 [Melghirimyces thermohalophilus]|uniref:Uncharacterized protein n=1 Tax=Melghirimyces thermohalophilus TaxID=1236220 RepID=A0A1G6RWW1_9BACL|nr:hypothetical protein [Melghirimyces thermohalophilus]SDD09170.1 hypothetical protein SAMN04488112_1332 [Melghirimyces thermohalophilus]